MVVRGGSREPGQGYFKDRKTCALVQAESNQPVVEVEDIRE